MLRCDRRQCAHVGGQLPDLERYVRCPAERTAERAVAVARAVPGKQGTGLCECDRVRVDQLNRS